MKKMNPAYIFFMLIGLFVMLIGGSFALPGVSYMIVTVIGIIAFFGIVVGMIFLAKKISGDAFEEMSTHYKTCSNCKTQINVNAEYCPKCGTMQEDVLECEYCGHLNPSTNLQCEECNALLK